MCDVSETNNECNDSKVKWRKQPAGGGTQGDGPAVIEDISKECFTDNKRYVNNEMLAESYVFAKMWTCCHHRWPRGKLCWKRRGGEEIDRDRWGAQRAVKWKGEFYHGGKYLQSRWVNEKEEKTQVFARTKWSSRMQMRQWPLSYFIRELNSRRTFYLCPDQHVFRCCLWRRGEGEGAEERGVGVEKEISEVKIYSKSLRKCIWKKRKGQ